MTTYYVSSEIGSDNNAGTSATAPFATLQVAADHTAPGDTVLVMNGTYSNGGNDVLTISTSGTAGAPITFEAAPGATPLIDTQGAWQGIEINASYITINGFTLVGTAGNYTLAQALAGSTPGDPTFNGNGIGVNLNDNNTPHHNIIIENNTIYNMPGAGIATIAADYLQILNNNVHDNAHWSAYGQSGISIAASVNFDNAPGPHIIVSGNTSVNNAELVPEYRANAITDGEGIILDSNQGYTGGFLVQNNTTHGNSGPGIEALSSDNAVITGNTTTGDLTNPNLVWQGEIFNNQSQIVTITNNITNISQPPPPPPGELVINGGFETGNFGGWIQSGNVGPLSGDPNQPQLFITQAAHTGNDAAGMGPLNADGTISQNLTTIVGTTYTFDFWLANDGGPSNDFTAKIGGVTELHLLNAASQPYTHYSYTFTATSAATPIEFDFMQNPARWRLDDVSVAPAGSSPPPPVAGSVVINDVTIGEGNSGTQVATFTVTRSGGTAAFAVNFATTDGTATVADNDYVAASGTLQFGANENTNTISVTINGDTKVEANETFNVLLSNATNGATISDNQGVGTITNDDGAATPPPTTNLVANGNFETGDFSGWTLGGNFGVVAAGPQTSVDSNAESGLFAANIGAMGSDATLSQAIQTTAGQHYTLTFWLANGSSGPNDFTVNWNGATVLSLDNAPTLGYTQYTYDVVGTADTSQLLISGRQDPSHWSLDAISVVPVAATTPSGSSATIGSGPDQLVLKVSEDAYLGDAQYTVSVDGVQVGGTLTAHASHAAGQDDIVTVQGNWAPGDHSLFIHFLNDGTPSTDRNLYLDGATYDGAAVPGASGSLLGQSFTFHDGSAGTPNAPSNLVTNGNFETGDFSGWTLGGNFGAVAAGPQTSVDSNAESGLFAANIGAMGSDATLSQAIQTTAGQHYTLTFWLANGSSGPNDFTVNWNGSTVLSLDNAPTQGYTQYTYDVVGTADTSQLLISGRQDPSHWSLDAISVVPVAATTPSGSSATIGSGPDQLVLKVSEDAYLGDAQYTVSVDGVQVGGTLTAHASHAAGQDDIVTVQGNWAPGDHNLMIHFLNDRWDGTPSTDRNLYLDEATYNGAAVPGASGSLLGQSFTFHDLLV